MLLLWLKGKIIYSCLHATVYYLDGGFLFAIISTVGLSFFYGLQLFTIKKTAKNSVEIGRFDENWFLTLLQTGCNSFNKKPDNNRYLISHIIRISFCCCFIIFIHCGML